MLPNWRPIPCSIRTAAFLVNEIELAGDITLSEAKLRLERRNREKFGVDALTRTAGGRANRT